MEDNRDQKRNMDQPNNQYPLDTLADTSGLHLQKPTIGAEQMNKSYRKPDPDNLQYQSANLEEENGRNSEAEKGHA